MLMSRLSELTNVSEATLIQWHVTFKIEHGYNLHNQMSCRGDVQSIIDDIKCLKNEGFSNEDIEPEIQAREATRRKLLYEQRLTTIKDDGNYKAMYEKLRTAILKLGNSESALTVLMAQLYKAGEY